MKVANRLANLVLNRDLSKKEKKKLGPVVHYAFGKTMGGMYGLAAEWKPDVILSDIAMPDEDGYSLIRRVRALDVAEGGRIPSIALTAYTRIEDRAKALGAGFNLHMGKPVRPLDLIAAVKTLAPPSTN